jgi:hypothetical protein
VRGQYLVAVFSPLPLLSLLGCALCGLSVGAMWPARSPLRPQLPPGRHRDVRDAGAGGRFGLLQRAAWWAWSPAACSRDFPGRRRLFQGGEQAALKAGLLCAAAFPILMVLVWGSSGRPGEGARFLKQRRKTRWESWRFTGGADLGHVFFLVKDQMDVFPPDSLLALRYAIAAALLAPCFGKKSARPPFRTSGARRCWA